MTTIARTDVQAYRGAAAAPDAELPEEPELAPYHEPNVPAAALLFGGASLGLVALLSRGANPLFRIGSGVAAVGLAIGGAMMLAMGDTRNTTGPAEPGGEDLAFNQERREGRTPNGGEWSVASYFDAHNQPVAKAEAAKVSIVEYNSDGIPIAETWGTVGH